MHLPSFSGNMFLSVVAVAVCLGVLVSAQQAGDKQQTQLQLAKNLAASIPEPAAAESNAYGQYGGQYRSGAYGGRIDPRYFDRGDTPHFGLAGFPFGYERRYYGQNVVYDNSLAGFPLNYYNYQQDYNNYNSYKPAVSSYAKPQYRSAAYTQPQSLLPYGPANVEFGAYLNKPAQNNGFYSLQYGY